MADQSINQHGSKTTLDWLFNILIQPSSGTGSGVSPESDIHYNLSLDLLRQALVEIGNVVNNVTTTVSGKVLDARQGKTLADQISAILTQKAVANGIATLGSDGKIPSAQIPSLALVDVFTVASQAEMLALGAEQGDMAIRTDSSQVFILSTSPASTLENWVELAALKALVDDHANRTDNPHMVTKEQVGLGSVDNTSDADKPVSTAQQTALDNKADKDTDAVVGNFASFDASGNTIDSGKKDSDYEDADLTILKKAQVKNNLISTNTDLPLSANQGKVLKEGQDELAGTGRTTETIKGNADDISSHVSDEENPHGVTKSQVGLANVDNTSDADKPVSTAQQTALNNKADKDTDAVVGNFASFDASGNPIDSGKKDADYEDADDTILKKAQVKNNLTSTNTDLPLSANQGKVLKDGQDELAGAGWAGETVKGNAEDIATLNGNDTTEGSVAKTVKDAVDPVKGTGWAGETVKGNAKDIATLNGDDSTEGSVAKTVKDGVEPIIEDVSDHESRIESLEREVKPLGVLFEGMPSVVTGERTLGASSTTLRVNAGVMNTEPYLETDIRFQYPFNEIKTAKINADFTINAWIDEPDFLTSDGIIATQLPAIYVNDDLYDIRISKTPRIGYHLHPLHIDTITGQKRNYVWVGADKSVKVLGENKLTCALGEAYYTNVREDTVLRPYSEAVGIGWSQADIALRDYLRILILIAGASHNTQSVFGRGVCDLRYTASDAVTVASTDDNYVIVSDATGALYNEDEWVNLGTAQGNTTVFAQRKIALIEADYDSLGNTRITVDGATFSTTVGNVLWHAPQLVSEADFMAMGNECGYIGTDGRVPVSFFGIWNLWGNIWEWCDGFFHVNLVPYYTYDPSKYSLIRESQPADLSQFTQHSVVMPSGSGYCGEFAGEPAVPSTLSGGSDSAGMCDRFYTSTGYKALRVGGGLYYGSYAGFFSWYVYFSPAYASWGIGSRLLGRP